MRQFKVAGLTAASHLSKILVSLFIIKQIALTHGPEGLGLLGNFMSLATIASTLAGGGIISGVIKYISQYSHSEERQLSFIGSALVYTLFCAICVLILGMVFINYLTLYVFTDLTFKPYLYFFLMMQIIIAFNNCAFGVVTGLKKNTTYAFFILCGNCIAMVVAYYCIHNFAMWGLIIAIIAPLVCPFIPILIYTLTQNKCHKLKFNTYFKDSKKLSKFSLMLIVSAICFPIVEMIIRNQVIDHIGLDAAGYWQAITKLSSAYLSFYSLFLTFYFIPIISAMTEKKDILIEVKKMIGFIAMLFIVMIAFFACFRHIIISMVLSDEFIKISDLFLLQMMGDFFRVIGWVIGFVVVAKAATKLYIAGEIVQGILFLSFTYLNLSYQANLYSVINAYLGSCILYCLIIVTSFYILFRDKQNQLLTG